MTEIMNGMPNTSLGNDVLGASLEDATTTSVVEFPHDDVRIAVAGNVDSGKSTLVGCLVKAQLDDGRGSARTSVFRHQHEQENGRTSSVASELMGFKADGTQCMPEAKSRRECWKNLSKRSVKTVTLLDLAGHERYLKTTVFGLTGLAPDYGLVVVGANMGVSKMTKEHIGICSALHLPFMIVVTKTDIAPPDVFKRTMTQIRKVLKMAKKMPYAVKTEADVDTAASSLMGQRVAPVLVASSVRGDGMSVLIALIRALKARAIDAVTAAATSQAAGDAFDDIKSDDEDEDSDAEVKAFEDTSADETKANDMKAKALGGTGAMVIDSVFHVPGAGLVVAGMVTEGVFVPGQIAFLGPDSSGKFTQGTVRSIHVHYNEVQEASAGKSAAICIRLKNAKAVKGKRPWVHKGQRLVSSAAACRATRVFTAEVVVLHHQTTISIGYTPVINCGCVSQTARITAITSTSGEALDCLRTNDRAMVTFQFAHRPETLDPGSMLLFREGAAKGVGKVLSVANDAA